MAAKDPEIASTVSFRPASLGLNDKVIGEHKSGYLEQAIPAERGKLPAMLPPKPQGPAPTTSLASRLRAALEKGA
jgi:hypothetical protein